MPTHSYRKGLLSRGCLAIPAQRCVWQHVIQSDVPSQMDLSHNWTHCSCAKNQQTMMQPVFWFIQWHNARNVQFSLCFGCEDCSSATGYYQPQNQLGELGLSPQKLTGKALKQSGEVQQAFQSFLARILEDTSLLQGERCRHLHIDVPPGMQPLADQQPRLALPQQIE